MKDSKKNELKEFARAIHDHCTDCDFCDDCVFSKWDEFENDYICLLSPNGHDFPHLWEIE